MLDHGRRQDVGRAEHGGDRAARTAQPVLERQCRGLAGDDDDGFGVHETSRVAESGSHSNSAGLGTRTATSEARSGSVVKPSSIGVVAESTPNGAKIDRTMLASFTDQAPVITPVLWRSKKFQGPHKENFAAFRVWFDIPPGGPQSPPATRTTGPATMSPPTTAQLAFRPGMFGVVRVIADGKYLTERELRYSTELMRVSSQSKYTTWQIEYEGIVSVTMVKMATTVKELATVNPSRQSP